MDDLISIESLIAFRLHIIDLCENCKTADDYRNVSEGLHDIVESIIQELCYDDGIEDYEPCY